MKKSLKILLVDDVAKSRQNIKLILKGIGFNNITEAQNGQSALVEIENNHKTEPFQFILCDLEMPTMSGLELVSRIRSQTIKIPFLMMASNAEPKKVVEIIQQGANGLILKPFSSEVLQDKIVTIFS